MADYDKLGLVKVSSWFERLSHTLLALSWLLLVFTGLAFYSKKFIHFAEFFGGLRAAVLVHNYTGIVFLVSVVMIFLAMFRESAHFDSDDIDWIRNMGGYLWKAKVPESGRFNPGQKGMYFFTIIMGIIMGVTGWTMWQAPTAHYFNKAWISICYPVHSFGGIFFFSAWMVHAYFGTICNPGSLQAMTFGWATKGWLRLQHGKWYREHVEAKKGSGQ
ncbi:MAG: formate dehydrogenase subunit gamma [bacterium]